MSQIDSILLNTVYCEYQWVVLHALFMYFHMNAVKSIQRFIYALLAVPG